MVIKWWYTYGYDCRHGHGCGSEGPIWAPTEGPNAGPRIRFAGEVADQTALDLVLSAHSRAGVQGNLTQSSIQEIKENLKLVQ